MHINIAPLNKRATKFREVVEIWYTNTYLLIKLLSPFWIKLSPFSNKLFPVSKSWSADVLRKKSDTLESSERDSCIFSGSSHKFREEPMFGSNSPRTSSNCVKIFTSVAYCLSWIASSASYTTLRVNSSLSDVPARDIRSHFSSSFFSKSASLGFKVLSCWYCESAASYRRAFSASV